MSLEREGFEILMTADAGGVVSGAKQASAALGETADATKDLDGKLKDAGHSGAEGAEGFKIFGHSAHEAHAALRVLNDTIPGVEQMARFLSNGLTATMGVGALAIGMVKKSIDDTMQALDSLQASPGARGGWADHLKEMAEQSAVAFGVFEDHIQKLIDAQETLSQVTERGIAQDRERISTANEIGKAEDALALARLTLAEKLGQVTPQQAIKIRLEIDESAFKRDMEAKVAEIQAELTARTNEQRQNGLDRPNVIGQVDSTKAAADAAAAAAKKNNDKIAQDKKNLADSLERQQKAQDAAEELEKKAPAWGYDKTDTQYYALKAARDSVDSESRQQGGLKASIAQEEGKQVGLDTAAQTSKAAYDEARVKYEEAVKDFNEAQRKIDALTQDLEAEKAKTAALESLHNQTAETTAAASEAPALHAEAAQAVANAKTVIATGGGVMQGSATANKVIADLTGSLNQMAKIQSDFQTQHVQDVDGLASEMADVKRTIQRLQIQTRTNRD